MNFPYKNLPKFIFTAVFACAFFALAGQARAATYYISPLGSDSNAGTQQTPFKTVQKGLDSVASNDILFIKNGSYDLAGFAKSFSFPISIIGESKEGVILSNGGILSFAKGFSIEKITFTGYSANMFMLTIGANETVSGIYIRDCIFKNISSQHIFRSDSDWTGRISNIRIERNRFEDLRNAGRIEPIRISYNGYISDAIIAGNVFKNLITSDPKGGAVAIRVGGTEAQSTGMVENVSIAGNCFSNFVGGTDCLDEICDQHPETHAIMGFGKNITVSGNRIIDINILSDHEGIYLKSTYSTVSNNILINAGGGDADITMKGVGAGNVVADNVITGTQYGRAIFMNRGERISGNIIKKPNSYSGIYAQAFGQPFIIENNQIEVSTGVCGYTANQAGYDGCPGAIIRNNYFTAKTAGGSTLKLTTTCGVSNTGNNLCSGAGCSSVVLPAFCADQNECRDECLVTASPYCGDNICNGAEACSTCPADCGTCPVQGNLLTNPTFEQGETSWTFYNNGSSTDSSDFVIINPGNGRTSAARITFPSIGDNMQLNQNAITLKQNTNYRLTFDAYSNTGRDLSIFIHKDETPYTNYGLNNHLVQLSQEWQSFTVDFTTQNITGQVSDARLRLWFAGYAQASDQYFFDNFSLKENTGDTTAPGAPKGLSVR